MTIDLQPIAPGNKTWANPELTLIAHNPTVQGGGSRTRFNEKTLAGSATFTSNNSVQLFFKTPSHHPAYRTIIAGIKGHQIVDYQTHS